MFAEIAKDGTILSSRNFPWRVGKGTDTASNTIYTIMGKEGDLSLITVKADPSVKYHMYKAWVGTTIEFTCPADAGADAFRIEIER